MSKETIEILRRLSACRIVPAPGQPGLSRPLRALLSGVRHFFSPGGGIFIGASSPEDIVAGRVCLGAKLAGRGGLLRRGSGGKFYYSVQEGFPKSSGLLGRPFAVCRADTGVKVFELPVAQVILGKKGSYLYFLPGAEKEKVLAAGRLWCAAHPAEFSVAKGLISCWDLASLANAAVALSLARRGDCYAWLSESPFPSSAGLAMVELNSFSAPLKAEPYGCFDAKSARLYSSLAALPSRAGAEAVSVCLGVMDYANGNAENRFQPETLRAPILGAYTRFVAKTVKTLGSSPRRAALVRPRSGAGPADETLKIAGLVASAPDFPSFLSASAPRLAKVYKRHGLRRAAISADDFGQLRSKLKSGLPASPGKRETEELADKAASLVRGCFPEGFFFDAEKPRVVSLLMGNSAVFSAVDGTVFVSPDRPAGNLRRQLFSELLFVSALKTIKSLNLPEKRARYAAEGLRYCLLSGRDAAGVAGALELSPADYATLLAALPELQKKVRLYLEEDICSLYEGKYHRYMKPRPAAGLPSIAEERFVAAQEFCEAARRGRIYETIIA